MTVTYADVENVVKEWLKASPTLAALVPLPGNRGPAVFLSMPKNAPSPVILCKMSTTAPAPRRDIPEQTSRFSFNVVAADRDQAKTIALALISLFENTSRAFYPFWSDGVTYILTAQTLAMRWLPDPDSDTPRYVVDALITTVT